MATNCSFSDFLERRNSPFQAYDNASYHEPRHPKHLRIDPFDRSQDATGSKPGDFVSSPDPLAEKTLWWTRWQTWTGGLGLVLTVMLGWTTVKGILVATWSGLTTGIRIPVWLVMVLAGVSIWLLRRPKTAAAVPSPSVEVPKSSARPEEATVGGVMWRWWPNRKHGRVGILKPYCPHCDLELGCHEDPGAWRALDRWTTTLFCHRCEEAHWSQDGRMLEAVDLTRKIIEAGLRQEDKQEAARG